MLEEKSLGYTILDNGCLHEFVPIDLRSWAILQIKLNFHLLVGLEERSGNHPSYYDSRSGDQKPLNKIGTPLAVAEILHNITIRWGSVLAFLGLCKTGQHRLRNCLHKFLLKIASALLLLKLPYLAMSDFQDSGMPKSLMGKITQMPHEACSQKNRKHVCGVIPRPSKPASLTIALFVKISEAHLCCERKIQTGPDSAGSLPAFQSNKEKPGTMVSDDHGSRASMWTCEKHHKADCLAHREGPFACQRGLNCGGGLYSKHTGHM